MTVSKKLMDWIFVNPPPGYTGQSASETLGWFLYHILAYPGLAYFPLVITNLNTMLHEHEEDEWRLTIAIPNEAIEQVIQIVDWLKSREEDWVGLIPAHRRYPPTKTSEKHPVQYICISTHPFYALLMCRNDQTDETNKRDLLRLQRLLLALHWSMMNVVNDYGTYVQQIKNARTNNHNEVLGNYRTVIHNANREALKLTAPEHATNLSELISDRTLNDWISSAKRNQTLNSTDTFSKKCIHMLALTAVGNQTPRTRRAGGRHSRSSTRTPLGYGYLYLEEKAIEVSMQRDLYDDSYDWPDLSLMLLEESSEKSFSGEVSPLEDVGETEVLVHTDLHEVPSLASIRNSARHIQKAHQLLPHQWDTVTAHEIERSLVYARKLLSSRHDRPKQYSGLLIVIQIATGVSLERSENIRISRSGYRFGEGVPVYWLPEHASQGFWCIPAYQIDYKTQQGSTTRNSVHDTTQTLLTRELASHLVLPDYFGFDQWLSNLDLLPGKGSIPLFTANLFRDTAHQYPALLKAQEAESRVTPNRLSNVIRQYLLSTGADIVDYSLISGNPHRLSTVKAHYSAPTTGHLIAAYQRAIESLLHDLTALGYRGAPSDEMTSTSTSTPDTAEEQSVGSRYCPKTATIQTLVATLQAVIEDPDAPTIDFHNCYTLYISLLIGYATGIRGVRKPYIDWNLLDPETDLLLMSDKNTADAYHCRWVWLPPLLQDQLHLYERYLERFSDANYIFISWHSLDKPDPTWNDPLFFVTQDWKPEVVKPQTICDRAGSLFPGPANHNRHWLRTRMSEQQVPSEAIDQFLGHWSLGEEPFATYSTTSPAQLLECVKPVVTKALDELGFVLLRPTLNKRRVTL